MALKKTIKLMLVSKTPYAIDNERTGETYQGFIYEGFDAGDRMVRFTSQKDTYPVVDGGEYEEKNARDFILFGRTDMQNRVKWRDYEVEQKPLTGRPSDRAVF